MNFEFATANRIIFGPGVSRQTGQITAELGRRAMLITGNNSDRYAFLFHDLGTHNIRITHYNIPKEPTVSLIMSGIDLARRAGCDLVIAIGGGSVMDSGKAIAAVLTNQGDLYDYLEVIGKGMPLENSPAPNIMLPTTAGTGTEVTRNAVIMSTEHKVKVSMRSPLMLPHTAMVDPELTYSMPPAITAGTGLDALTQLLEAFVSIDANPVTDAVCRDGLRRAARGLERAFIDGNDKQARFDMCLASLFGGMALANAKLGAVHGIAGPFGGMVDSPHGAVCGRLLPSVMQVNINALQERSPKSKSLTRYTEVARILTGHEDASAVDGIEWVQNLCERLAIPTLSEYGLTERVFPILKENALRSSSMKGNPIQLTNSEVRTILVQAC